MVISNTQASIQGILGLYVAIWMKPDLSIFVVVETGHHYSAQPGLKPLLSLPSECQD